MNYSTIARTRDVNPYCGGGAENVRSENVRLGNVAPVCSDEKFKTGKYWTVHATMRGWKMAVARPMYFRSEQK